MKKFLSLSFLVVAFSTISTAQCDPAFTFTINQGTVSFQAQQTGPGKMHIWRFGDGTNGYGASASHLYTQTGIFNVLHTVWDSISNCVDSLSQAIQISVPTDCHASFLVSADSSVLNKRHFVSNSTTSSGTIQVYNWSINGLNAGNGNTLTYTFIPGFYSVCLKITTSSGCTSTTCQALQINDTTGCNLTADFIATASPANSQLINFVPTPLAANYRYYWNFGDGFNSTQPAPAHTYVSSGNYNVNLWITDSVTGCVDTIVKNITIFADSQYTCTANITYTVSNTGLVSFSAHSNQTIANAYWYLSVPPDSVFLYGINPSYQYADTGMYSICLFITTNTGCTFSECRWLFIDSLQSNRQSNNISSYPNPAANGNVRWYVNLGTPQRITYRVLDINGNTMYQSQVAGIAGINVLTAPVEQLRSGQYFAEIIYGNIRKRSIFIKP